MRGLYLALLCLRATGFLTEHDLPKHLYVLHSGPYHCISPLPPSPTAIITSSLQRKTRCPADLSSAVLRSCAAVLARCVRACRPRAVHGCEIPAAWRTHGPAPLTDPSASHFPWVARVSLPSRPFQAHFPHPLQWIWRGISLWTPGGEAHGLVCHTGISTVLQCHGKSGFSVVTQP